MLLTAPPELENLCTGVYGLFKLVWVSETESVCVSLNVCGSEMDAFSIFTEKYHDLGIKIR